MRRRGGGEEGGGVVGAGAVVRRLDRIRKRGALSSSGGSGAARKLRFRAPAVLLRRRSGAAAMSEASSRTRGRHCRAQAVAAADGARPARRLVGAFWQMDKERLFGEDAAAAAPPPRRSGLLPRSRAPTEASEGHAAAFSQIYRLIWFWWLFDSSNLVSIFRCPRGQEGAGARSWRPT